MGRTIGKLTAMRVATLAKGTERALHGDGGGLWLQVTAGGASWVFRYRVDGGRLREMGLGPLYTINLAEAREKALRCRQLRLDGRDPIDERRAERAQRRIDAAKAMTFKQCAEAYIAAHQAGWRNAKHTAQWPASLNRYAYPIVGALPVQAIDLGLVMKVIEPIWSTKPETASRVRGRIESVLDWATTRGYRQGENPARWRGHLESQLPKKTKVRAVEHHAALPYREIGAFMVKLQKQGGVGSRALEFAILTGARTGEIIDARWTEISMADRLWTIPAARMKAGKEHRVPLSDTAVELLTELLPRSGGYVFTGAREGRPMSHMTLLMTLRRLGRGDLTVHGFRSTFSDWCAEQTNFPTEVREMALAHAVSDRVEAAYRRGDLFEKRRQLAEAWAKYCGNPVLQNNRVASIGGRK
jgi:integrase